MKQPVEFQKFFDHTLLKPDATREEILKLCRDAAQYDFASVCVNGCHVRFAVDKLKDTSVKVAAVTGFPLGAMSTKTKSFETKNALENGASEIDTVINIGALKDGRFDYIQQELIILSTLCHRNRAILKVILETGLLTEKEIRTACILAERSGADFVKTSTGFNGPGATVEAVKLMKRVTGPAMKIKASGGIRTLEDARAMIEAGADRLGCSASVAIMEEYLQESSVS